MRLKNVFWILKLYYQPANVKDKDKRVLVYTKSASNILQPKWQNPTLFQVFIPSILLSRPFVKIFANPNSLERNFSIILPVIREKKIFC